MDNQLGMGLLPDDQEMIFSEATIGGIRSYMAMSDSLPVSQLGLMALGNYTTDGFGYIRSGAAVQIVPNGFTDSEQFFGYKPVLDSIFLNLQVAMSYGDTSINQKFYIYKLVKPLPATDETMYGTFDAESYADMANPLFSFEMQGVDAGAFTPELTLEAAGEDYVKELMAFGADDDYEIYNDVDIDSLFRQEFYGVYITPSPDPAEAPLNSALYFISPLAALDSYYYQQFDYTYLEIYYHTHYESIDDVPDDDTPVSHTHDGQTLYLRDTLTAYYSFDDTYLSSPNTNIMVLERDYSTATLFDPATDFVDPETFKSGELPSYETIYIQGMLGVAGYLDFGAEFLDALRGLAMIDGEERIMQINRARLYMWLEDDSIDAMDMAPPRLGMYYTYDGYYPLNIPDYYYYYEQTNSIESGYLGYINRTHGYYEMDITMYLLDLLTDEDTPRQIWLGPGHTMSVFYVSSQVAIQNPTWDGTGDPPATRMQLKLTYTLLKKTIDD